MTDKEAMKLALEALESCTPLDTSTGHVIHAWHDEDLVNKSITSLRQAIKELESQEPVVLREALREALTTTYVCGRVWSAWNVGTMTEDDFQPAADCDELLDSLIEAVAIATPPAQPAQRTEQEPIARFTGKFTVDAHDRMLCEVVCSSAIPTAGAALYDAPPQRTEQEPVVYLRPDLSTLNHSRDCRFHDDETYCTCYAEAEHELEFWRSRAITPPAQPAQRTEQEPVAWMLPGTDSFLTAASKTHHGVRADSYTTPLYTTPPQRKPLTEEQIEACLHHVDEDGIGLFAFARAIEAAHGIKENT